MKKKSLITIASPRSGLTWLNRLLSDALSSGMVAVERGGIDDPVFAGPFQHGDYLIRKSHWAKKYNAPTVLLFRDPRDVAVSRMHYRKMTDLSAVIQTMHSYEKWMRDMESIGWTVVTSYEKLHRNSFTELHRLILVLTGQRFGLHYLAGVWNRQQINNIKKANPHSARKGMVGDWKNYFGRVEGKEITNMLGDLMLEQGYIDSYEWWHTI